MGNKFLDQFNSIAPALAGLFGDEKMGLYSTDLNKFLMVVEHNTEVPFAKAGLEFSEKGAAYRVIQTKKPLIMELPASLYGKSLKVTTIPVFDDDEPDKVVGTYGMAITRDNAFAVKEAVNNFKTGLSEVQQATAQTATAASEINLNNSELQEVIFDIGRLSGEINGVLDAINHLAAQTKMLGINASIESARTGEAGRGFGVVAQEIRKLSDHSKETADLIRGITRKIDESISRATQIAEVAGNASREQAAAVQEINAQIEQMLNLSEVMEGIAAKI